MGRKKKEVLRVNNGFYEAGYRYPVIEKKPFWYRQIEKDGNNIFERIEGDPYKTESRPYVRVYNMQKLYEEIKNFTPMAKDIMWYMLALLERPMTQDNHEYPDMVKLEIETMIGELGKSARHLQEGRNQIENAGIIKKIKPGLYWVNPEYLFAGDTIGHLKKHYRHTTFDIKASYEIEVRKDTQRNISMDNGELDFSGI